MKNSSLLSLLVLVAASPLAAAAWSRSRARVSCGGGGSYAANSTYEANRHHLAAVLPAEAAASRRRYASRALGYWPNRLQADWSCQQSSDGDCAACIADAFERVERECPFSREAFFFGRNCTLRLGEYSVFGSDVFDTGQQESTDEINNGRITMTPLAIGMMFQAFGLACLFLLFLRAWRHDIKKCTVTRHTPPLPGDQYMSGLAHRVVHQQSAPTVLGKNTEAQ